MGHTVDSTNDARTLNNVMRHEYRKLSDEEKELMQRAKDQGVEMVRLLHEIGKTTPTEGRQASRELSLAQTKIEEAVMWAVKYITK